MEVVKENESNRDYESDLVYVKAVESSTPGESPGIDVALELCGAWRRLEVELGRIRNATLEEAAKAVEDGSFLHDKAPAVQFAKEVAAMLRRKKDAAQLAKECTNPLHPQSDGRCSHGDPTPKKHGD